MPRRCPYLHHRKGIHYFFWKDESGKRHEESLRTRDLEIAKERYRIRTEEIENGRSDCDRRDWTLGKACEVWLGRRQLSVARGSYQSEKSIVGNLERILGKECRLRSLADISHVQRYQLERLKEGLCAKTVNNEVMVLSGILRDAQLWHRVRDYRPLRTKKSDIPDALTHDESKKLLEVAANAPTTAVAPYVAALAESTGMRSGEIKKLQLGDLHENGSFPYLTVRRSTTKTDAGARQVALGRIAIWAIKKLKQRAFLIGCGQPEHYLLPTDRSRHTRAKDPLHGARGFDPHHPQSSWESEWNQLRQSVGITHRRFHDLRHTYITRAAEAGVPMAVVEAQVGHMSSQMARWYTHISSRAQHEAANRIDAANPELLEVLNSPAIDSLKASALPVSKASQPSMVSASDLRQRRCHERQRSLRKACA